MEGTSANISSPFIDLDLLMKSQEAMEKSDHPVDLRCSNA